MPVNGSKRVGEEKMRRKTTGKEAGKNHRYIIIGANKHSLYKHMAEVY